MSNSENGYPELVIFDGEAYVFEYENVVGYGENPISLDLNIYMYGNFSFTLTSTTDVDKFKKGYAKYHTMKYKEVIEVEEGLEAL